MLVLWCVCGRDSNNQRRLDESLWGILLQNANGDGDNERTKMKKILIEVGDSIN